MELDKNKKFRMNEFRPDLFHDILEVYMMSYEGMEEYGERTRGDAKRYIKWLVKNSDLFLVLFYEDRIIGFVAGSSDWIFGGNTVGEIHEICVLPEFRGIGLGKILIDFATEYFLSRGLRRIGLWVGQGNESAIKFYKKLGFHDIGEKFSVWVRMEKEIGAPGGT